VASAQGRESLRGRKTLGGSRSESEPAPRNDLPAQPRLGCAGKSAQSRLSCNSAAPHGGLTEAGSLLRSRTELVDGYQPPEPPPEPPELPPEPLPELPPDPLPELDVANPSSLPDGVMAHHRPPEALRPLPLI
jgi:hypothetical protein